MPTIATWTGSFRNMRAYVPKHQSMQLKNLSQVQHIRGLPNDWDEKVEKVHQLISRVPYYNKVRIEFGKLFYRMICFDFFFFLDK